MIIESHLPAPTAVPDPFAGLAAPGARTPPRFEAHDPLATRSNSRLRREPARADRGEVSDRSRGNTGTEAHGYREGVEVSGRSVTSLFFAQLFAQQENPGSRPPVAHEAGAAAYPSLSFDDDILLPGEAVPFGWSGAPRLDILV